MLLDFLPIVRKTAAAVTRKRPALKDRYEDLVQDGVIGLLMAEKTYKAGGQTFGTWAKQYVEQQVHRAANAYGCPYSGQRVGVPMGVQTRVEPEEVACEPDAEHVNTRQALATILSLLEPREVDVLVLSTTHEPRPELDIPATKYGLDPRYVSHLRTSALRKAREIALQEAA